MFDTDEEQTKNMRPGDDSEENKRWQKEMIWPYAQGEEKEGESGEMSRSACMEEGRGSRGHYLESATEGGAPRVLLITATAVFLERD